MKTQSLETQANDELVEKFERAAREHGKATEQGDYRTANKAADAIWAISHELRNRGRVSHLLLVSLLQSPDGSVRTWAATHLLDVAPDEAVPVLEDLASGDKGYLRLDSEMVLKEWRAGRLPLP